MLNSKNNEISFRSAGPRVCALLVDGTGTAALYGPDKDLFTLTDNGTGDYTLTLASAAQITVKVLGIMSSTANAHFYLQAVPTTSVVRVLAKDSDGTGSAAKDVDFQILLMIDQAPSAYLV